MAENESLDLWNRNSRRWQGLLEKIKNRKPSSIIVKATERCLYRTLQNVEKQLPLRPLLSAAVRGDDLEDLIRKSENREYANFIKLVVEPGMSMAQAAAELIRTVRDRFLDQIELEVVSSDAWPTAKSFAVARESWKREMAGAIHSLASKIAGPSGVPIRMPPMTAEWRQAEQEQLIHTSLLG